MCPADALLLIKGSSPRTSKDTAYRLWYVTTGIPGKRMPSSGRRPQGETHPESNKGQVRTDKTTNGTGPGRTRPRRPKTPTKEHADANRHKGKPRKKTPGGTPNKVFGESFQLVSPWKPIGKRPLEMSPVLVSWVSALAVFLWWKKPQLTYAGSLGSSRGKKDENRNERK